MSIKRKLHRVKRQIQMSEHKIGINFPCVINEPLEFVVCSLADALP